MKKSAFHTSFAVSVFAASAFAADVAFALKSDREETVFMQAVEIDVDFRLGTRTLRHDVIVTQGTTQIVADKVIAEIVEDTLDAATAWGEPAVFRTLPDGQEDIVIAKGDRLHFDNTNQIVTINGNARIVQRDDVISGGLITYNLATEVFTVRDAEAPAGATASGAASAAAQPSAGRARVVVQPREQAPSSAAPAPDSAAPQEETPSADAPPSSSPSDVPQAEAIDSTPTVAGTSDAEPTEAEVAPEPAPTDIGSTGAAAAPEQAASEARSTEVAVASQQTSVDTTAAEPAAAPQQAAPDTAPAEIATAPEQAASAPEETETTAAAAGVESAAAEEAVQVARAAPGMRTPKSEAEIQEAVGAFVVFYETYYQLGDAERLSALFVADGVENDRQGDAEIRGAYEDVFDSTTSRQAVIDVVEVDQTETGELLARGTLTVTLDYRDGRRAEQSTAVELSLVDDRGMLRIARMRY